MDTADTARLKWPNLGKVGAGVTACFVAITSITLGKHLFVILVYGWPAYSDGLRIVHSHKQYAYLSNGDRLDMVWATVHTLVIVVLCLALMCGAERLAGIVPRGWVMAIYAIIALATFVMFN
jgi:hypothetical protein